MMNETKRKVFELSSGWFIKECEGPPQINESEARAYLAQDLSGWIPAKMPNTVQEILFEEDLLDRDVLETGISDKTLWVSEKDWAFRTEFTAEDLDSLCWLVFERLDTVVDIFLNGEFIGRHESMYLESAISIDGKLRKENSLLLYFHSPKKIIATFEPKLPANYDGKIAAAALLRKPHGDFSSHAGVVPYFTPIGVYGPIKLVQGKVCVMEHVDVEIWLNEDLSRADVIVTLFCTKAENIDVRLKVLCPDDKPLVMQDDVFGDWEYDESNMSCSTKISIENPQLWWPKGYGEQLMYNIEVSILNGEAILHTETRRVGLRKVEMLENLKFRINGHIVRLWGTCFVPMWGVSHRWQKERGLKLLEYADKAHMKAIRLWGPSQPYDDEFYDEADRLGILIWQEFHTNGTHIPDLPIFTEKVIAEAKFMIRRLKHRPSVFMWCGGNESIYMADIFDPKASDRIGHELFIYTLRDLVHKLDPTRYYHISAPCGGAYANEARVNDNHGSRASLSYLPGERHAHFFSEDIRTTVPELKSVKRFIAPEDLWPEGYVDTTPYGVVAPMPPAWMKRTINHMEEKTGPYELFYDATDPESLVYKINEAAVYDNRLIINHIRQGKPFYNSMAEREGNGYLIWKMQTAWPQMYCALIDFYMEPGRTYYGVRRAYDPIKVTVDMQDHVYIWGINDTPEHFGGMLSVRILDLKSEVETHSLNCPIGIPSGESMILKNLDGFGQFWRTSVIYASIKSYDGKVSSEDFQFVKPERKLQFPEAKLTMQKIEDRMFEVKSDRFARCVELRGEMNGDSFGWHFEDNYFDLMPGQKKAIRIFGKHSKGKITAKAYYSPFHSELVL